jgi:hypothetical protein
MAPRRGAVLRALLRVAPFLAVIAGAAIMAIAVLFPMRGIPQGRLFLAGAIGAGFGVWVTRPTWQELRRPMPAWHED